MDARTRHKTHHVPFPGKRRSGVQLLPTPAPCVQELARRQDAFLCRLSAGEVTPDTSPGDEEAYRTYRYFIDERERLLRSSLGERRVYGKRRAALLRELEEVRARLGDIPAAFHNRKGFLGMMEENLRRSPVSRHLSGGRLLPVLQELREGRALSARRHLAEIGKDPFLPARERACFFYLAGRLAYEEELSFGWAGKYLSLAVSLCPGQVDYLLWSAKIAFLGGDYRLAARHFRAARQAVSSQLGPGHRRIPDILDMQALAEKRLGARTRALRLYMEALDISCRLPGPDYPEIACRLERIAGFLQDLGTGESGRSVRALLGKAAELLSGSGGDSPVAGRVLRRLARIYGDTQEYGLALDALRREILLHTEPSGRGSSRGRENWPGTGKSLEMMGCLHAERAAPEAARPYFLRSLGIFRSWYGDDHPSVAMALVRLAGTFPDDEQDKVAPLFRHALAIMERVAPIGDDSLSKIRSRLSLPPAGERPAPRTAPGGLAAVPAQG